MAEASARYYARLFAHDAWANRETLDSLRGADLPEGRPLGLLAHIGAAERLWLSRLRQEPQPLPVWPKFSLDECRLLIEHLPGLWMPFLEGLEPSGLDAQISYRNSKGEDWANSVADILTHVLLHSSYHRGQIAQELRKAGGQPPYTDFIHSVRTGLV